MGSPAAFWTAGGLVVLVVYEFEFVLNACQYHYHVINHQGNERVSSLERSG